jgi:hypothetical protein
VIAQGEHITIKVNGSTTATIKDNRSKKGHLALQRSGPITVVKFYKIEIKKLPPPRQ